MSTSTMILTHRYKLPKGSIVQLRGLGVLGEPNIIDTIDSERDVYFDIGTTLEYVYPDGSRDVVEYSYQVVTPQTFYRKKMVTSIVFNIEQLIKV